MSTFEEIVREKYEKSSWTGKVVETVYGHTSFGQQYAILLTKGVWYKVRLITKQSLSHTSPEFRVECIEWGETLFTLTGASEIMTKIDLLLRNIEENYLNSTLLDELFFYYSKAGFSNLLDSIPSSQNAKWRCIPYSCKQLPPCRQRFVHEISIDSYLMRGDIIRCHFYGADHVGVYLGNAEMANLTHLSETRKASGDIVGTSRIIELRNTNVLDHVVEVIMPCIQVRTKESIAKTAEYLAAGTSSYALREYSLREFLSFKYGRSTFQKLVEGFCDKTTDLLMYGHTSLGQQYAILLTKYKIRLITELRFDAACINWAACAPAELSNIQKILGDIETNKDEVIKHYVRFDASIMLSGHKGMAHSCRRLPDDWANMPDNHLKRGDIIRCPFYGAHHVGIYLGDQKVAHVSGHGDGKTDAGARIGELIPNFVDNATSTVELIEPYIRVRTNEDVASTAERYAAKSFRKGEYHLLMRNCQHFVTLCAFGEEFSLEHKNLLVQASAIGASLFKI